MPDYYDGTKLLSLLDRNKKKPEIFISTTNRSAGKTTYFNRLLINRFKNKGEKFVLLYRYNYEMENCAEKFFNSVKELFFPADEMTDQSIGKGLFYRLILNNQHCGYAVSLNRAEQVKKMSHLFSDVSTILFDEFQTETNIYVPNEIEKFISIHYSIARGGGEQSRYVPVYLISNLISMINPYYAALKIPKLPKSTKYYRGNGFVLEQGFNQSAAKAQETSSFNRAFGNIRYIKANLDKLYMNDNYSFISKISGPSRMIRAFKFKGEYFQLRSSINNDEIYFINAYDETFKDTISVLPEEHDDNTKLDIGLSSLAYTLRIAYANGAVKFDNLKSKDCFLNFIDL